jgi:hypothetical protein
MLAEEKKLVDEILSNTESESESQNADVTNQPNAFAKKYLVLKNYIKKTEQKFIDLETQNLKSIQQVYGLLNREQKLNLIRNLNSKILPKKCYFLI